MRYSSYPCCRSVVRWQILPLQYFSLTADATHQVFWTSLSIVGGGVYYQEFDQYSEQSLSIFVCCMAAIFVGVYMLAPSREDRGDSVVAFSDQVELPHREAMVSVGSGNVDIRDGALSSNAMPRSHHARGESWIGSMSMPVLIMTPNEASVDPNAWGDDGGRFSTIERAISDPTAGAAEAETSSTTMPLLLAFGRQRTRGGGSLGHHRSGTA